MDVGKIIDKYKQHKNCKTYYKGFKTLYDDILARLPKAEKTLDVGCAYGFMALLMSEVSKVEACDITDEYTNKKMLKDYGVRFFKHNIEKKDLKGKYDLITMIETIEHLNSNPLPVVKRLYKALNKGGSVVLTTVAREIHGSTKSMNDGKAGLWDDLINWRDIPKYKGKWKDEHSFHYSQLDLVSLFTEAGFEVEECYIMNEFTHYLRARRTK